MTNAPARIGLNFLKLGAGEAAARLIAFAATIYVARTLGAGLYGVIALATAVMLYLSVLADCGVEMLGIQEVAAGRDTLERTLPEILGARLLVGAVLAVITVAVALLALPEPEGAILATFGLVLLVTGLGTRWVHLGLEHPGRTAVARVAGEALAAALVVTLVRSPGDLARVPLAHLAGEGLAAYLLIRFLPRGLARARLRLQPALPARLLQRSWPMVLHALLGLAIFNADFIFLRILRDSAAVGHYAAAYTLISFLLNLGVAYTMSLIPALTELRDHPDSARPVYDAAMAHVLAAALPLWVGGLLVARPLVALVFGAGYAPAAVPLAILLGLIPLAFIRNVSQGALLANGRQDQLLRTVAWAAGTNLLLNALLIPRWGLAGAAWATVLTEAVRTGLALVFTHRLGLPMTHPRRFLRLALAVGAMAMLLAAANNLPVLPLVILGAVGYGAALAALGGVRLRNGRRPELTV